MGLRELAKSLPGELRRFAWLEEVLGALLILTPAVLIWVDSGPDEVRDSISAYYNVGTPQAFYVPLTVGAMLFFANGIVRRAHVYNMLLGLALLGVILFDHEGATSTLHTIFAVAFFGGNVVVMAFFSTRKSRRLKIAFAVGILVTLALWKFAHWFTLFWAEWVSLAVIAIHFVLDSVEWSTYRALKPGETPKLAP